MSEIVVAAHHRAFDPWVVRIGATVLDVPDLVAELFECDEVMRSLPGDPGERHLTGEVEEDDLAAFAQLGLGVGVA